MQLCAFFLSCIICCFSSLSTRTFEFAMTFPHRCCSPLPTLAVRCLLCAPFCPSTPVGWEQHRCPSPWHEGTFCCFPRLRSVILSIRSFVVRICGHALFFSGFGFQGLGVFRFKFCVNIRRTLLLSVLCNVRALASS